MSANENRKTTKFLLTLLCWYSSATISSSVQKLILTDFTFPLTLTTLQFASNAAIMFFFGQIKPITYNSCKLVAPISLFHASSHICSSNAISLISVSLAQTIKAVSPLFTVLLYYFLYRAVYSFKVYFAVTNLTVGVAVASFTNSQINILGIILALTGTFLFSCSTIYSKKILSQPKPLDNNSMICIVNILGLLVMIPIWIYYESTSVIFPKEFKVYGLFALKASCSFFQSILGLKLMSLV